MTYSTHDKANEQQQQQQQIKSSNQTAQFVDNRASTTAQLAMQQFMHNSPRATVQYAAINTMNASAVQQQKIIQRMEPEEELQLKAIPQTAQLADMDEEELLQGKFETAQRVEEEELLQGKFETTQRAEDEELLQGKFEPAQRAEKPNSTGLPDNLKSGIENLSGMSMDHVKVHYNSEKPAQLQAHAYAQGSEIHVAPGQEQHLPHEAWHVVQQAQGRVRPTVQMKGGVQVNDNVGLEAEADVMGAEALSKRPAIAAPAEAGLTTVPGSAEPRTAALVVQRRMGLEAETRRVLNAPDGTTISEGDTKVIEHEYFTLVTDKFRKTSNLEFVMKHFDQLAGTEPEAVLALKTRIDAMQALHNQLYAQTCRLGNVVPELGPNPTDIYSPQQVSYKVSKRKSQNFDSSDATVNASPHGDDTKLYVHYTVGFRPAHWLKMVRGVHQHSRPDTTHSRASTIASAALDLAGASTLHGLTADELEQARGHIALMYMQLSVWSDRTASLQEASRKKQRNAAAREVARLESEIEKVKRDKTLNILTREAELTPLEKALKLKKRSLARRDQRLTLVQTAMEFGTGQVKNKILALPRASLAQMYGTLAPNVQRELSANAENILNALSEKLETEFGLDLNEECSLDSDNGESATLGDFLKAGLGSGTQISQQVLFGGMSEVGVDNGSGTNPNLVPFEFRSMFEHRVSWGELRTSATDLLKWSRNPT
jgi:hypothetical protein